MPPCLDPQARLCLLRHLHAVRHGLDGKPCHGCEPAAQVTAALREARERPIDLVERGKVAIEGDGEDHSRSSHPWVDHAAPTERRHAGSEEALPAAPLRQEPEPTPPAPAPSSLDLEALRAALLPFVQRQAKTGQKSMYLDRLQDAYNAAAPRAARITGRKRFASALAAVPGLSVQGSWLLLDRAAVTFCCKEA